MRGVLSEVTGFYTPRGLYNILQTNAEELNPRPRDSCQRV